MNLNKITWCVLIAGISAGGLLLIQMPMDIVIDIVNDKSITFLVSFLSFYLAGIFPTIALLIGHFGGLDVGKLSHLEVDKIYKKVKYSLYSLFFIFFSIMIFVFCVFLVRLTHKYFLLHHFMFIRCIVGCLIVCATSAFLGASYGIIFWLPKNIMEIFNSKQIMKEKEVRSYFKKNNLNK